MVGWVWVACGWRWGGGGWVGMGEHGEGGGRRGGVQRVRVAWQGAVVVCGCVGRVVWCVVCGLVLRGCVAWGAGMWVWWGVGVWGRRGGGVGVGGVGWVWGGACGDGGGDVWRMVAGCGAVWGVWGCGARCRRCKSVTCVSLRARTVFCVLPHSRACHASRPGSVTDAGATACAEAVKTLHNLQNLRCELGAGYAAGVMHGGMGCCSDANAVVSSLLHGMM